MDNIVVKHAIPARRVTGLIAAALLVTACGRDDPEPATEMDAEPVTNAAPSVPVPPSSAPEYPQQAYWGDTHVHTGWSADAGMDGAVTSPEDAYRLARGEEVKSNSGQDVKLDRPFDWFVMTDHSDAMGTINEVVAGNPEMIANPTLKRWSDALKKGGESAGRQERTGRDAVPGKTAEELMDPKWMVSASQKTSRPRKSTTGPASSPRSSPTSGR